MNLHYSGVVFFILPYNFVIQNINLLIITITGNTVNAILIVQQIRRKSPVKTQSVNIYGRKYKYFTDKHCCSPMVNSVSVRIQTVAIRHIRKVNMSIAEISSFLLLSYHIHISACWPSYSLMALIDWLFAKYDRSRKKTPQSPCIRVLMCGGGHRSYATSVQIRQTTHIYRGQMASIGLWRA